jgi:hypothetical protein
MFRIHHPGRWLIAWGVLGPLVALLVVLLDLWYRVESLELRAFGCCR